MKANNDMKRVTEKVVLWGGTFVGIRFGLMLKWKELVKFGSSSYKIVRPGQKVKPRS